MCFFFQVCDVYEQTSGLERVLFSFGFAMCMGNRVDLAESFCSRLYDVYEQASGLRWQTSGVKRIIRFLLYKLLPALLHPYGFLLSCAAFP